MAQQLTWLLFIDRIEFKILLLVLSLRYKLGSAFKYLCDHIRHLNTLLALSALSSLLIAIIFFPCVRIIMAHTVQVLCIY